MPKKKLGMGLGMMPSGVDSSNPLAPMYYPSTVKKSGDINYAVHPDIPDLQGTSVAKNKQGNTIFAQGQTNDDLSNLTDEEARAKLSNVIVKSANNFWNKKAAAGKLSDTFFITKGLDGSPTSEWEANPNMPALSGMKIKASGDKYSLFYNDKPLEQLKNVSLDEINNTVNNMVKQYVAKLESRQGMMNGLVIK